MESFPALQVARFPLFLWPRFCAASNPRPHHLLPSSRTFADRVHSNTPFLHLRRSSISATRAKPHPFSSFSCSAAGASPPPPGEDQNFVSEFAYQILRYRILEVVGLVLVSCNRSARSNFLGMSLRPLSPFHIEAFGLQSTLSRIQDRVRIFFAVLFWMALFFWGSAWDNSNSAKKKGPWFRK